MPGTARILIVVVGVASLRSTLVARLGLAGETFMTAETLEAQGIPPKRRDKSFLVVDPGMLPTDEQAWEGHLSGAGWNGPVAVLLDGNAADARGRFTFIDSRRSAALIVEDVRRWRDTAVILPPVSTPQ